MQYLEMARKRVASEQESPKYTAHGIQLKPVHVIIADSAKRPNCPTPPPPQPTHAFHRSVLASMPSLQPITCDPYHHVSPHLQLLRKLHIGNDIVTIIFQEPGCEQFSPRCIRSHFKHIFVIVRVENPNTKFTKYR